MESRDSTQPHLELAAVLEEMEALTKRCQGISETLNTLIYRNSPAGDRRKAPESGPGSGGTSSVERGGGERRIPVAELTEKLFMELEALLVRQTQLAKRKKELLAQQEALPRRR